MTAHPRPAPGIDLICALTAEDCVHVLRRAAREVNEPRLRVRSDDLTVWVEARVRWGRSLPVWMFRFEGTLRPVETGTHVRGRVMRNRPLEGALIAAGIITLAFMLFGVGANVPFVKLLSLFLLGLFAAYYARYQRLLHCQCRDLTTWIEEWLTVAHGWAGGSLP